MYTVTLSHHSISRVRLNAIDGRLALIEKRTGMVDA
jgi:hypothetical protein